MNKKEFNNYIKKTEVSMIDMIDANTFTNIDYHKIQLDYYYSNFEKLKFIGYIFSFSGKYPQHKDAYKYKYMAEAKIYFDRHIDSINFVPITHSFSNLYKILCRSNLNIPSS